MNKNFLEMVDAYIQSNPSLKDNFEEGYGYYLKLTSGEIASMAISNKGMMLLTWMQRNWETYDNLFNAKDIADGLQITSHGVTGAMRRLVSEGLVSKEGKSPVIYSLTEKGKNY